MLCHVPGEGESVGSGNFCDLAPGVGDARSGICNVLSRSLGRIHSTGPIECRDVVKHFSIPDGRGDGHVYGFHNRRPHRLHRVANVDRSSADFVGLLAKLRDPRDRDCQSPSESTDRIGHHGHRQRPNSTNQTDSDPDSHRLDASDDRSSKRSQESSASNNRSARNCFKVLGQTNKSFRKAL